MRDIRVCQKWSSNNKPQINNSIPNPHPSETVERETSQNNQAQAPLHRPWLKNIRCWTESNFWLLLVKNWHSKISVPRSQSKSQLLLLIFFLSVFFAQASFPFANSQLTNFYRLPKLKNPFKFLQKSILLNFDRYFKRFEDIL